MDHFENRQHSTPVLAHPLRWATRMVTWAPWTTLAIALLAGLLSLAYAAWNLELHTSRLALLNPQSGYNRLWIDYIEAFGDEDDLVVVVEGQQSAQVLAAIDDLAAELLLEDRWYHNVFYKVDLRRLAAKGLYYLTPEQLQQIDEFLLQAQSVTQGDWSGMQLGRLLPRLTMAVLQGDPATRAATAATLNIHVENLRHTLAGSPEYHSPWALLPDAAPKQLAKTEHYLLEKEGRLGLILLHIDSNSSSLDRGTEAIEKLRALIAETRPRHPSVSIGLTGLPVMENDEMRSSERSTMRVSIVSLAGVSCLFVAGFGGVRLPLLTVGALLIGIAWSVGYVALAVGHLNILSMSFGIILIGLGIDFGIHYVSRYLQVRRHQPHCRKALEETAQGVGAGIVTGGVTTSLAFFAAGLTSFTGVAELGVIAGGGILFCVLAAMVVLPALIMLNDSRKSALRTARQLPIGFLLLPASRAPRLTVLVSLVICVVVGLGLPALRYDHNLLNLQPVGLESVRLERRLLDESDQSVWFALSVASSPAELRERKARFETLGSVERTEEILSLLPDQVERKQAFVRQIHDRLATLPGGPATIPVDPPNELAEMLERLGGSLGSVPDLAPLKDQLRDVVRLLRSQPLDKSYASLAAYQRRMASELFQQLSQLQATSEPEPPGLGDLNASLVERFVGQKGQHLMKVYSRADIWDMDALEQFVTEVRSVDPRATGKPLQTFEASRQMQASYLHAASYALVAVLIVLILDLHSLRLSLLALLPVSLGMLLMFGILGMLQIPLNPANMIVLPLILGIGLDDGVHVVHDFRSQRGKFRLSDSTTAAILLTSVTTMVGFGSMMIADHRGLQSLGRVLTIGVSCCLFTSVVTLPALLAWLPVRRLAGSEVPSPREPRQETPLFELRSAAEVTRLADSEKKA